MDRARLSREPRIAPAELITGLSAFALRGYARRRCAVRETRKRVQAARFTRPGRLPRVSPIASTAEKQRARSIGGSLAVIATQVVHPEKAWETGGWRPSATRAEAPDEHPQECPHHPIQSTPDGAVGWCRWEGGRRGC